MDHSALSQLSEEQLAVLDEELKAVFLTLDEADQKFFASTFKAKDLPVVLARKAEILKRNQADQERIQRVIQTMAEAAPASEDKTGEVLTGAAAVLGVGAAAAMVASDDSAFYQGVKPVELLDPLRTEFHAGKTGVTWAGPADALTVTIYLVAGQRVPAMNIQLTQVNDGTQIKMNELTTQSILETIKAGGGKLIRLAGKGLELLFRSKTGTLSPGHVVETAQEALESGTGLAELMHDLKLKERAWKVIRQTAEALEANYKDEMEKERKARLALEAAWDNYYACPTCGVAFGSPDEQQCRVCGTGRPEKPLKADPRNPS